MAIIIPSSKTYDRQNPKIRDNVIERIEVGAVEVVPNNEYETPVYNGTFENIFSIGVTQSDTEIKVDGYGYTAYISYVEAIPQYGNIKNFDVAILKNNHYIEKLLLGKDRNENPNINISFIGNIYKGKATQQRTSSTSNGTNIQEVVYQEPTYKENGVRYELPELTISNTVDSGNGLYVATASVNVNNETNIVNLTAKKITIQNIEYFRIENLKVLCGLKIAKIGKILSFTNPDNFGTYTLEGEYEEYIPTQIEITIYGNTIGIDLTDKTVYINGETQKKVHSVDGNELMQTTNYIEQNGAKINAIEKMYGETQVGYARGKETAKIRCSISDYYDENGEKVISIDKSTGRMSFKEYDEVIPMVYGADGKDYPMSLVNGKAKVFQVLGAKKYYNGAVWQELSLQEVGELELPEEEPEMQTLTAPTISLDGNTLTMTATDDNTQEFVIFVDGVETATLANEEQITPTVGLAYTLDGTTQYACTGIGTATDTDIVIADDIDGVPVTYIDEGAFHKSSVTSVVIGNSVWWMMSYAFSECTALTSVVIPASVTIIGEAMFYGCTLLTSIKFKGTVAQWNAIRKNGTHLFDNVPATYVQCTDGTVSI